MKLSVGLALTGMSVSENVLTEKDCRTASVGMCNRMRAEVCAADGVTYGHTGFDHLFYSSYRYCESSILYTLYILYIFIVYSVTILET